MTSTNIFSPIERREVLYLSGASFLKVGRDPLSEDDPNKAETKVIHTVNLSKLLATTGDTFKNKTLVQILWEFRNNDNVMSIGDMTYSVNYVNYSSDPEVPGSKFSAHFLFMDFLKNGGREKIFAKMQFSPYCK